jgi:chromosome segregation ATPase
MRTRLRRFTAAAIAVAVVTVGATFSLRAAPELGQAQVDPVTALLGEVRALRIAMERSATVSPRLQLTIARLNIEEQRIAQLAAQVDQVRRELTAATLESQKLSEAVAEMENGLQTATDDKVRKGYEYEQVALKGRMSAQARLQEQLRARENEAEQSLSTEQARWADLNARLDELERLLAPVPR